MCANQISWIILPEYFIYRMIRKSENPQCERISSLLYIPLRAESNCKSLACNGSEAKAVAVYRLPWVYSHH